MKNTALANTRFWVLSILAMSGLPTAAWSQNCKADSTDGLPYFVAELSGLTFKEFNPGDFQVGQIIERVPGRPIFKNARPEQTSPVTNCSSAIATHIEGAGAIHSNTSSGAIYRTSVPNIGVRLIQARGGIIPAYDGTNPHQQQQWRREYQVTFELIKTGNVTAAGVLQGAFLRYLSDNIPRETLVEYRFAQPVAITPRVPTCKVESKNIHVAMEKISSRSLVAPGATGPESEVFDIVLKCAGGDLGTSTNAHVTLTDASQSGNRSNTLTLANVPAWEKKAAGVGVQILRAENGQPLAFGADSNAVGNRNQWHAGNIPQGQGELRIPLKARYVRTPGPITEGVANARATFTMSYQ